jgi:hypothetical protein
MPATAGLQPVMSPGFSSLARVKLNIGWSYLTIYGNQNANTIRLPTRTTGVLLPIDLPLTKANMESTSLPLAKPLDFTSRFFLRQECLQNICAVFSSNCKKSAAVAVGTLRLHLSCIPLLIVGFALATQVQAASIFGGNQKDASVKVTNGGEIKGKSTVAIGAFRVAFVTEDAANASTSGIFGSSAVKFSGVLVGVDHALMQKIADDVYADFLKQAAAKGYTVIESSALVKSAAAYAALAPSDNFTVGRLGTFVIPTGQRSVALAADNRAKEEKGTAGFSARFNIVSDQVAKSPAYEAFPVAARQADAAILAVTIVANFANFKGSGSMGGSKASLAVGATIDGRNKNEIIPSTSILGWNNGTGVCPFCQAQFGLEGQIHSDESIGTYDSADAKNNPGEKKYVTGIVTADPAAYEKNILLVASQAIDMLLDAVSAEK